MSEIRDVVPFDAIILAGGRGSRLGGVSKADLVVSSERLLDRVLRAAAGARCTVVVGDVDVPPGVVRTVEDPPGTGPAAGLVAGLDAITNPSPWTLVLACDLPGAPAAVARLLAASAGGASDGRALVDATGRTQHLLALYRTSSLRAAADAYGDPADRSVKGLIAGLVLDPVDAGDADVSDIDTWDDHARWEARSASPRRDEDRSAWRPFIERACAAVGVDPALVDEDAILRLAKSTSQAGAKPMAPVATFILGLAVGSHPVDEAATIRVIDQAVTTAPNTAQES